MRSLDTLTAAQKTAFADAVFAVLGPAPFGAVPKSELDHALFSALVEAGHIDLDAPAFVTAQQLEVTPTKVGALAYAYRLRTERPDGQERRLAAAIGVARVDPRGDVVLNVEDRYWRDTLVTRLKAIGVFTDTSFNRERVTMPVAAFDRALEGVFGAEGAVLRDRIADARKREIPDFVSIVPKSIVTGALSRAGALSLDHLLQWAVA